MATRQRPRTRVGCSGWQYASWKGPFYPPTLPTREWLPFYGREFDTVELNYSFYQLPEKSAFAKWRATMPEGFCMAVKASRYLTHLKRLREPTPPLHRLVRRAQALGDRLGPILYQLPGTFRYDRARLTRFLYALDGLSQSPRLPRLPQPLRHVIEFRHPGWYRDDVFALLREHGVAFCVHDRADSATPRIRTAPFVYVRFHGASGHYHGEYGGAALRTWAAWLATEHHAGADLFVYFNNDPGAAAVRDARVLRRALERRAAA